MNPKVLFAVQGEGRGHMTQAIALYDLFKKIILRFVARLSELVTEEPYLIFFKSNLLELQSFKFKVQILELKIIEE